MIILSGTRDSRNPPGTLDELVALSRHRDDALPVLRAELLPDMLDMRFHGVVAQDRMPQVRQDVALGEDARAGGYQPVQEVELLAGEIGDLPALEGHRVLVGVYLAPLEGDHAAGLLPVARAPQQRRDAEEEFRMIHGLGDV